MNKINFDLDPRLQQHAVIKDILKQWVDHEAKMVPITSEADIPNALWYGIITINIFSHNDIKRAFASPNETKLTYTRLAQVYLSCCAAVGRKAIDRLHKEMDITLKEFGIRNYKTLRKTYPFLILIPILNELYREQYSAVIFRLRPEQRIAP